MRIIKSLQIIISILLFLNFTSAVASPYKDMNEIAAEAQQELDLLHETSGFPSAWIHEVFMPSENKIVIRIIFSDEDFVLLLNDLDVETIWKSMFGIAHEALAVPFGTVSVETPIPFSSPPEFRTLPFFIKSPPAPLPRDHETMNGSIINPESHAGYAKGALSGKTIYLSQCHGFYWNSDFQKWVTQRGNHFGIVEDLVNPEAANQILIRYLLNAGAQVFPLREFDINTKMVIVDNDDPENKTDGIYEESGDGFGTSVLKGFKNGIAPYYGEANPFEQGTNRYVNVVSGNPTAYARWTPEIPESGFYNIYVSYSSHETRAFDAHYVVKHPAGETSLRINQKQHGATWVFLGNYYFDKGLDPETGSVILLNDSEETGNIVISADAVRFGGGMGDVARGSGTGISDGPVSNRARFEECCRYYAQFSGAPADTVYDTSSGDNSDDVSCRSRFAAWHHEQGEDAVFVSWHTNAFNGNARFTSSYIYGDTDPGCCYEPSATEGSEKLVQFLHNEIVADIQKYYDPQWKEHGKGIYTAWFGELNPKYNPEMPAALIEVAFHDNETDASYIKDPQFRKTAARAFYHGIVRYFADRDNKPVHLIPEPPAGVYVKAAGNNQLKVTWNSPENQEEEDPPSGYRIYTSRNGRDFDNGTDVIDSNEYLLSNPESYSTVYVKVTTVNEGGESFPSPVAGAMVLPESKKSDVLIVSAFDRMDSEMLIKDDQTPWNNGIVERMFLKRMNAYDYIVRYGEALAQNSTAFDSAWHDAVSEKMLNDYKLVIFECGEESYSDQNFSSEYQSIIKKFLENGGDLVVSGSEVLKNLDFKGTDQDKSFAHDFLKTGYMDDDAETYAVEGIETDPFTMDLGVIDFDDGKHGCYDADSPDILIPFNGAKPFLNYSAVGIAATYYKGDFSVIVLGFPFETVYNPSQAEKLMSAIIEALGGDYTKIESEQQAEIAEESSAEPSENNLSEEIFSAAEEIEPAETYEAAADISPESDEEENCRCGCSCDMSGTDGSLISQILIFLIFLVIFFSRKCLSPFSDQFLY
jgi:hypothetical protein